MEGKKMLINNKRKSKKLLIMNEQSQKKKIKLGYGKELKK